MKKSKALIIGGSGFLGSHIADSLAEHGYSVTVFDRMEPPWLPQDQRQVLGDMLDYDSVRRAVEGVDYVYHLAGEADIGTASLDPLNVLKMNINGGLNAMHASADAGVKRFVFASSVYTHGDKGSFYRVSKQALEEALLCYAEKKDLPYTILHYGTLYGPRAQSWNGLHSILKQGLDKGCIRFFGTGQERREFIHVRDAARLSVKILEDAYLNKRVAVTGLQSHTILELLMMIEEITDGRIRYSLQGKSNGDRSREDHYFMTPYRFRKKETVKIISDHLIDVGQGIVEVLEEIEGGEDALRT